MPKIDPKNCLARTLFGYHFAKPSLSIANSFNELADTFLDTDEPSIEVKSKLHLLQVKLRNVVVSLSHQFLNISTTISIADEILELFPEASADTESTSQFRGKKIPTFFHDDKVKEVEQRHSKIADFKRTTIKDFIYTLRLIEGVLPQGLPPSRFTGLVEYYYIPLEHVKWTILEKFKQQAAFPEGINALNTEKNALNRYYFPDEETGNEDCLLFRLIDPNNHKDKEASIGGAMFDYQSIPNSPASVDDMGGPKPLILKLAEKSGQIIESSQFLVFE